MAQYIFAIPKRVPVGVHILSFKANTPREVPEAFVEAVVKAGGFPVDQMTKDTKLATPTPKVSDAESINQIGEAMLEIIALDDETKLTGSGMPRANEIEKVLGRATTRDERDAAFALIEE